MSHESTKRTGRGVFVSLRMAGQRLLGRMARRLVRWASGNRPCVMLLQPEEPKDCAVELIAAYIPQLRREGVCRKCKRCEAWTHDILLSENVLVPVQGLVEIIRWSPSSKPARMARALLQAQGIEWVREWEVRTAETRGYDASE